MSDNVKNALKLPNFYQNQDQFWKMLGFIRQKQDIQLSNCEYRQLSRQLNLAIENAQNYQIITLSGQNIYHIYFLILSKLRGGKTVQNWMANEEINTLKDLHCIYKLLYTIHNSQLPGFGNYAVDLQGESVKHNVL